MDAKELQNYVYQKNAVAYPMRMDADLNGELPQEVIDAYNQIKPTAPAGVKIGLTTAKISFKGPFEDIEAALEAFSISYILAVPYAQTMKHIGIIMSR